MLAPWAIGKTIRAFEMRCYRCYSRMLKTKELDKADQATIVWIEETFVVTTRGRGTLVGFWLRHPALMILFMLMEDAVNRKNCR